MSFWDRITSWAASPYSSGMSLWGWFLFLGMILLLIAAWAEIFGFIRKET